MKDIKILVFGDSITYGEHDNQKGGWVNRLRLYLENNVKNYCTVFNLGIPGEISNETIKRFDNECKIRFNEDDNTIIIFAIGINDTQDINGKNRIELKEFKENIKNLYNNAQKYTNNIIFIGLTNVDESKTIPWNNKSYFNNKIALFDSELEKNCLINGAKYIKMFGILIPEQLSDGLHPNNIGHEKIFTRVVGEIEGLL